MLDYSFQAVLLDLKGLSLDDFITKRIFDATPFVFRDEYDNYVKWRRMISKELRVDSHDIIITGSAAIGYSFNPRKNFKAFNEKSDIDICIISDYFFNVAWHDIRNINTYSLDEEMRVEIEDHKTRLIYWETIATDKILPLLSFGNQWNKAMNTRRGFLSLESHDIKFRIYRNAGSARAYQKLSVNNRRTYVLQEGL